MAEQLLRSRGRFTGPIVRFMRKAIGLTADEFAVLLGTTRVEVSRWENGHVQMSGLRELQVRLEVIDKLLPAGPATTSLREEVIGFMTRHYVPDMQIGTITVDATNCYPALPEVPPVRRELTVRT